MIWAMLIPLLGRVACLVALHAAGLPPSDQPTDLQPAAAVDPDLLALPLGPLQEDETDGYYDNLYRRFGLSVGYGVLDNFDSTVRVDSGVLIGAVLDMEDFLGIDESQGVGRIDAHYAFNRRHRIDLSYYDIARDGRRTVPNDIQVGNVLIPAGEVDSEFDTLILKLDYRYNFVADERTTIGASFGFHVMGIDLAFRSDQFNVEEEFNVDAPLPVLGLHAAYALSHKWSLSASSEFFQVDVGDFSGTLIDNRLTLAHDWFEHFGWGIGFNGFSLDAELEDDNLTSDIEYAYQGLIIYLRAYF